MEEVYNNILSPTAKALAMTSSSRSREQQQGGDSADDIKVEEMSFQDKDGKSTMENLLETFDYHNVLVDPSKRGEKLLASILCGLVSPTSSTNAGISFLVLPYLAARDIAVCNQVCSSIHKLLASIPIFPGLFLTEFGDEFHCKLYPHQIRNLIAMKKLESSSSKFGALRGGIFGDAPGLGKTVTSLALIASTAGSYAKQLDGQLFDVSKIDRIWNDYGQDRTGTPFNNLLNKTLITLWKGMGGKGYGVRSGRMKSELFDMINKSPATRTSTPFLDKFPTMKSLEKFVVNEIVKKENLMVSTYDRVTEEFRRNMNRIKLGMDPRKRAMYCDRLKDELDMIPSSATLIIAPLSLLEHWYEQIKRHLNIHYYTDDPEGRGVVWLDGFGDIVDITSPLPKLEHTRRIQISAETLSQYFIVVTTFERCDSEFLAMHQQRHVKVSTEAPSSSYIYDLDACSGNADKKQSDQESVVNSQYGLNKNTLSSYGIIHKVRWLRLIIDEGHELGQFEKAAGNGKRDATSSIPAMVVFISTIAAERRWIMSGTPTVGSNTRASLMQIHRLLTFLRHPNYLLQSSAAKFDTEIVDPFLRGNQAAFNKLVQLLTPIVIRHSKKDLSLYEPIRTRADLDFIEPPIDDKVNLIGDEVKFYTMANHILNVHSKVQKDYKEAVVQGMKKRKPKFILFAKDEESLQLIAHYLYLSLGDSYICEHWGEYRSCELSRFRHSKRKLRICPLCGYSNGISSQSCDEILYVVEYIHQNVQRPCLGGCYCSLNGCESRSQCIGYSTATSMNMNGPNRHGPNRHLIAQHQIQDYRIGRRYDVGNVIDVLAIEGVVTESSSCRVINDGAEVDNKQEEDLSTTSSKDKTNYDTHSKTPILFKNGVVGGQAIICEKGYCGRRGFAGFHSGHVLSTVEWQVVNEDASILLLGEDGSHGLDLSFATHLFLVKHIDDPALESQIISRAHRMGATGPVEVIDMNVKMTHMDFMTAP